MSVIEQTIVRLAARIMSNAAKKSFHQHRLTSARERARALQVHHSYQEVVKVLDSREKARLKNYLLSPAIDDLGLQTYSARILEHAGKPSDELLSSLREQVRFGLKHAVKIDEEKLFLATDAVVAGLLFASSEAWKTLNFEATEQSITDLAIMGSVTAAAIRNSDLLKKLSSIEAIEDFNNELRRQSSALYRELKLPHAGVSRSVPIENIFVEPALDAIEEIAHVKLDQWKTESPKLTLREKILTSRRIVILGDPGAGKSTIVAKLTQELSEDSHDLHTRTPLLLILRDLVRDFEIGGKTIAECLEFVCRDPYNLTPPPHAIEYLLLNGRAIVIFDGLDELTDTSLRTRVVRLIEGFVHRYPLVPIVATSRLIGYDAAPLSDKLFTLYRLQQFNENQVSEFAGKWFDLDPTVAASDVATLRKSFLADSRLVLDLRRNPLTLTLLCSMYSTERYIPRNRPEVFERCTLMLFDRWDRMRGVKSEIQYGVQIRTAIQHLAWELLTVTEHGGSLPRHRIVRELANNYFRSRRDNQEDALQDAEDFIDFCTGRSWVLTDVGATRSEPRFGFTHRTFLEYFSAEHLVRSSDSSPQRVFDTVIQRIAETEWEVVCQLAIQILDRNAADGADRFLGYVLDSADTLLNDGHDAHTHLSFVARSLGFVTPGTPVVRRLIELAGKNDLGRSSADLFPTQFDFVFNKLNFAPRALPEVLDRGVSEFSRDICRSIVTVFDSAIVDPVTSTSAALNLLSLSFNVAELPKGDGADDVASTIGDLIAKHVSLLEPIALMPMSSSLRRRTDPELAAWIDRALGEIGVRALYTMPRLPTGNWQMATSDTIIQLGSEGLRDLSPIIERHVEAFTRTPWVEVPAPVYDIDRPVTQGPLPAIADLELAAEKALGSGRLFHSAILWLPAIEFYQYFAEGESSDHLAAVQSVTDGSLFKELYEARAGRLGIRQLISKMPQLATHASPALLGFIDAWAKQQHSTLALLALPADYGKPTQMII
ncbi:NACHT domain-containing protein [Micromonospora sp. A202]|uniref:NACHT domain-containing protein n=1 Tax=Micromonospora sp. A202 TaxID=2572899 RepID=UPI0011537456|nr:NACHT domain-containing protein [Micromonospora sp. A202]TQJ22363.1 NACHT domain-containing protein [Micromonospora sp. A202]